MVNLEGSFMDRYSIWPYIWDYSSGGRASTVSEGEQIMKYYSNTFHNYPAGYENVEEYDNTNYNLFPRIIDTIFNHYIENLGEFQVIPYDRTTEKKLVNIVETAFDEIEENCGVADLVKVCIHPFLCKGEVHLALHRDDIVNGFPFKAEILDNRDVKIDYKSEKADLSDAKWALYRKWLEHDDAIALLVDMGYEYDEKGIPTKLTPEKAKYKVENRREVDAQDIHRVINNAGVRSQHRVRTDAQAGLELTSFLTLGERYECDPDIVSLITLYRREAEMFYAIKIKGVWQEYNPNSDIHQQIYNTNPSLLQKKRGQRVYEMVYLGDELISRSPSRYGSGILAPWVSIKYAVDDLTKEPFGIGRALADIQDSITGLLKVISYETKNSQLIVSDRAINNVEGKNILEKIERLVKQRSRADGVTSLHLEGNEKLSDVVMETQPRITEHWRILLAMLVEIMEGYANKVSQGAVGSLRSGEAIANATANSTSSMNYGLERFKIGLKAYGDLIINHTMQYRFNHEINGKAAIKLGKNKYGYGDFNKFDYKRGVIDNMLALTKMKTTLLEIPTTASKVMEEYHIILDAVQKTGDPRLMGLAWKRHPQLQGDEELIRDIDMAMNAPDPAQQAAAQLNQVKAANIDANTIKQVEQTKSEEGRRQKTQAQTAQILDSIGGTEASLAEELANM